MGILSVTKIIFLNAHCKCLKLLEVKTLVFKFLIMIVFCSHIRGKLQPFFQKIENLISNEWKRACQNWLRETLEVTNLWNMWTIIVCRTNKCIVIYLGISWNPRWCAWQGLPAGKTKLIRGNWFAVKNAIVSRANEFPSWPMTHANQPVICWVWNCFATQKKAVKLNRERMAFWPRQGNCFASLYRDFLEDANNPPHREKRNCSARINFKNPIYKKRTSETISYIFVSLANQFHRHVAK